MDFLRRCCVKRYIVKPANAVARMFSMTVILEGCNLSMTDNGANAHESIVSNEKIAIPCVGVDNLSDHVKGDATIEIKLLKEKWNVRAPTITDFSDKSGL